MGQEGNSNRKLPISEYQKIFFLEWALAPSEIVYNISIVSKITGALDEKILKHACDVFIERNEIVHAQYSADGESCYYGNFCIDDFYHESTFTSDLPVESQIKDLLFEAFDLTKGPLLKLYLIKNNEACTKEFYFFFVAHHIICDAIWILQFYSQIQQVFNNVLKKEKVSLSVNRTFTQAVQAETKALNWRFKADAAKFWLNFISEIPLHITLPYRTGAQGINLDNLLGDKTGEFVYFDLSRSQTKKLRVYAQQKGTSVFIVLSAIYGLVLSKYINQKRFFFSYPVNTHPSGFEDVAGCFVNNVPMKIELEGVHTLAALIDLLREQRREVKHYQNYPLIDIISDQRKYNHWKTSNAFNTSFAQSYLNVVPFDLPGLEALPVDITWSKNSIYELGLLYDERSSEIKFKLEYRKSLFDAHLMRQFIGSFKKVITELISGKEILVKSYSALLPKDYDKVINKWNATSKDYTGRNTIYELFQEHVERNPDRIALVYENWQLTYGRLNEKSNQLARHIRKEYRRRAKQELTPDTLIALCISRSFEIIISILGVLKAGAAYVPIDPLYPLERIDYLLKDTGTKLILCQKYLIENNDLDLPENKVIYIDLAEDFYHHEEAGNLPAESTACNLAYVIYTSGTTGKPNGVMVEHGGVCNYLHAQHEFLKNPYEKNFYLLHSYAFDTSISCIFGAICFANTLIITNENDRFSNKVYNHYNINIAYIPPALLASVDKTDLSSLNILVVSGESTRVEILEKFSGIELINEYGPTECIVGTTYHRMSEGSSVNIIGHFIRNKKGYALDSHYTPVPIGVTGELYIGGAGLARGYLNNPVLTAERFIDNQFATIEDRQKGYTRLYKTGDLVKFLVDGKLEYMGRNDDQVKIRGYRVELGEVENALMQINGIRQSCVIARERQTDTGSTKYLVGYYVWDSEAVVLTDKDLLEKLSAVLPGYMVPAALVPMQFFPLTINGKLDKRAFADPDFISSEKDFVAPGTEVEISVCKIWQKVLGLERVGITDDFFRIGGNSILAIQVSHQMSKFLGCEVKIADIFKYTTPSGLLLHSVGQVPVIIPKTAGKKAILSSAQERLWFIEQYEQGTNAYHIPILFELDKTADIAGVKYAIQRIISRHEVLRSTIEQGDDHENMQVVHEDPLPVEEVSLTTNDDYQKLIKDDINQPFNLKAAYPVRVKIYRFLSEGGVTISRIIVLINFHHIASDGWSLQIFQKELLTYYEAYIANDFKYNLPALKIQYKDYAVWQRSYLKGDLFEKQLSYWKDKLCDYKILDLPTDYVRPSQISYKGANEQFTLTKDMSQQLRMLAKNYQVTLYSVLLSSIDILLGKYTGQEDIVIGTAIANRQYGQTEDLIGFFVNTQVNRTLLDKFQSFEHLVLQVHQEQVAAQSHQDLPFEKLVDELKIERDSSRHPIFQVMFGLQSFNNDLTATATKEPYIRRFQEIAYEVEKFDLSIFLDDSREEIKCDISYATALFHKNTIQTLIGHYTNLLYQLMKAPHKAYSGFCLLRTEEYQKITYEWNANEKIYPKDKTIHQLFEEQVERSPTNIALVYGEEELSYRQLNEKSNQLARHIRDKFNEKTGQTLKPDTLIALCMVRSLEMMVSIIAVHKAGGAYVPVDPSYPAERIAYILKDTATALVLTQRELTKNGSGNLPLDKVIYTNLSEKFYQEQNSSNLSPQSTGSHLAYVIYTSGTTGKPKGVMIQHGSLNNFCRNVIDAFDLNQETISSQIVSLTFDGAVCEIYPTLNSGGKLHILPDSIKQSYMLVNYIKTKEISHFSVPSNLIGQIEWTELPKLKSIHIGGGVSTIDCLSKWSRGKKLINAYGPTEAAVSASMHIYEEGDLPTNIGKPLDNCTLYVLDNSLCPVPLRVTGELYIGGAGLARGYLNNDALTAERFVANPFATSEDRKKGYTRLYKTGDLVRWLPDGELEFIGRNDDQVKIRGHRIEPGEIEDALRQIKGISQSCVLARERKTDTGSSKYLVGYYVLDADGTALTKDVIIEKLSAVLPDYMVPAALVEMESFPLTINSKLDTRTFPDPEFITAEKDYVPPGSALETSICGIWQNALKIERVGITDNFFRIGGNSILAMQLSHRMSNALGCEVRVADVFKYKSIAQLLLHSVGQAEVVIPKTSGNKAVLSFAQERLWFIEQYEGGTNAYHMPILFELDIDTNEEGIKYAIQQIVSRHEVLRSTIEQGSDQQGMQVVHEELLVVEEVSLTDRGDYEALIKEDINRPFDLSTSYPVRVKFYRIESGQLKSDSLPHRTIILINVHHIASDGWSMKIFQRELLSFYEAYVTNDRGFSLPAPEIQYRDYAVWQRGYLSGELLDKQLSYWKDKLSGYRPLELPTDYARPAQVDYRGAGQVFTLSREISQRLRSLAKEYEVTLHSVLLSSVNILLSKCTGQDDIVIGTATANRQYRQTENLMGFFVNTQVNRTVLDKSQSYKDLTRQVHQEQIGAQLHQDLPFEKLVDELRIERDTSRHPVFQVMFGLQSFGTEGTATAAQKQYFKPFEGGASYEVEKFDLSIFIDDGREDIMGQVSYATALFSKETITRLIGEYTYLLDQLTEEPQKAYSGFSLLRPEEYERIIYEWNATDKEYPGNKTVHELFEEQVERTPGNIALVYEGESLNYRELNERSNQLARHIRAEYRQRTTQELKADTLVGLCLDRSLEMVIGILAVLKAGGAYVPIDPGYPQERIDFLLQDSKAELVLSKRNLNESTATSLPADKVIYIDLPEKLYQEEDNFNLPLQSTAKDLAYVIYTSGTTGKPKGVMVEHGNVMRLFTGTDHQFGFNDRDVWTLFHSYVFDFSVWELWGALIYGGKLIVISKEQTKDMEAFYHLCIRYKVSVLNQTPSAFYRFAGIAAQSGKPGIGLRYIIFGGEALNSKQLEPWWSFQTGQGLSTRLVNMYGITETTVHVTYKELTKEDTVASNIGRPLEDLQAYVLDKNQNPVPIGVIGELHVGGAGLSRGYLNNEALTSERFIANRFATESDKAKGYTRLYRTGDLVRWQPGGELEYIGRNDEQVKIRGYRIELGEIEHALSGISGIKQSCVLARERKTDTGSSKYLVGYYVLDGSGSALSEEVIREKLGEVLPDYMVPGALVAMEWFPLTINGKLDKAAFPDPGFSSKEKEYVAPVTETERALCRIWEEVLGLERVGTRDNFFRIGGDSILSIQVSGRMRKAGFNCQVKDIFTFKTIVKLSEHLGKTGAEMDIKSEQGLLTGGFGLLPIQEWFKERVESGGFAVPNHWNQSFLVKVPALDTLKLCSIIEELVNYHDVLRLRYTRGERWEQVYQRSIAIPSFKQLDVRQHSAAELRDILTQWQSGFDLEVGPLFQAGYLYGYEDGSARIFFAMHHMIADGVSWRIVTEDIKTLYEGKSLPAKGSSYRQWVECVRQYGEQHQAEGLYWKDQLSGMPGYRGPKVDAGVSISFVELSKELTSELLQKSSGAYHTEINDLLITGLAYALKDINGSDVHGITLEGHGREGIDPLIDHSHTVGWYTSMFPVKVVLANTLKESIRSIKEGLRKIPARGIGFGAFAVKRDSAYTHKDLPPVSFNYLGQFDMGHGEWEIVGEDSGVSMDRSNEDDNLININGMVSHGELRFSIATRLGQDIGRQLGDSFKTHLASIVGHCSKKLAEEGSSYTPSDFKSGDMSQRLLDRLQWQAKADQNELSHIYPANSLQQGFIYHALSQTEDDAYRVQLLYDYYESIDTETYKRAWELCIAQYPILRTAFNWEEEMIQVIYREGKLEYHVHDISDLVSAEAREDRIKAIQVEDRAKRFDLTQPTLLRLHIIKHTRDHYTVIKTEHHSIADGWSGPILLTSVHRYYQRLKGKQVITIKEDTAYLEAQDYISSNKAGIAGYWNNTLAGVSVNDINALLSVPIDLVSYRQVEQQNTGTIEITGDTYKGVKSFSQREGITINAIVQFMWHKLLQVYSSSSQSIVGTTVSGRNLPIEGIEESVGLYINTLPLVVDWENNNSVLLQLHHIQEQVTALNTHSFADLAGLQKDGHRLFHSLFVFENYPIPKNDDNNTLEIRIRNSIEKVDYPLSILAYEHGDAITIKLQYDGKYLTEEKAGHHIATLKNILDQVITSPQQLHRQISLLSADEYGKIIYEWNAREKEYRKDSTMYQLFEEQVERTPGNIALVYEGESLSYRELNERSNQLARHIRDQYRQRTSQELKPDTLIGLCLDRSLEMVIGILAVLKAGGAYVPIDPGYPQERIDYILADTQVELVLSQRELNEGSGVLPEDRVIYIDLAEAFYQGEDISNLPLNSSGTDLAYVIYTSGTTGKPKGALIEHHSLVNLNIWYTEEFNLTASDNHIICTEIYFDLTQKNYFSPLIKGSTIFIPRGRLYDPGDIAKIILSNNIKRINCTPSAFTPILDEIRNHKQVDVFDYIFLGGEPIPGSLLQAIKEDNNKGYVVNTYGPTECCDVTTFLKRRYEDLSVDQIPLGIPVNNFKHYVLDSNLVPVPIGVTGELYIGGAGLGRGYLNNPALTAERFIDNQFATKKDRQKGFTRLYKTGDLVKFLADGNLEYMGRNDEQVKIRGYRIELSEVENALTQISGIRQSCVIARERQTGSGVSKYLVGYYVLNDFGQTLTVDSILNKLSGLLPEYMVPGVLQQMESFPLTINGKLDKRSLPEPGFNSGEEYVGPSSELESRLCRIYAEVLGLDIEEISTGSNFFRMGGNSILSIQLKGKLNQTEEFREVSIADLFKYNTIKKLIGSIEKGSRTSYKLQATRGSDGHEIAIIGMSGAFSGGKDLGELWQMIAGQKEGIEFYSKEECRALGVEDILLENPDYVAVAGRVAGIELFDPLFWEMSPNEARMLNPQIRKFMEHCWFVLESSGYAQARREHTIGVFAGSGDSDYLQGHIVNGEKADEINMWEAMISNNKDALATKTAFLLDLSGPANSINTACSTGLVSVVEACKNLQLGICDMALAGGVSLSMPGQLGYVYQPDMIASRDGHCRPFDKEASGTTGGSGVGVVLLRRLEDAISEGDNIIGVIKGYATNNDGGRKIGYTAPSVIGQSECIINAQRMAGITPDQIDYVECHGTATHLGDPIEVQGLKEAFAFTRVKQRDPAHKTILGGVKANIGHTDSAAGTAGLIKVCAMLTNNILPGQANFNEPNVELHLEQTDFEIIKENRAWLPGAGNQRLAAVSSFGIGGTNAHVIVGDYVADTVLAGGSSLEEEEEDQTVSYIIAVSAKSRESLEGYKQSLVDYLLTSKENEQAVSIRDLAYTLQERREHFNYRKACCARSTDELIAKLRVGVPGQQVHTEDNRKIVFMFPGQGAQYTNMARELYDKERTFKAIIDQCIKVANQHLEVDLYKVMYPVEEMPDYDINETQWSQICLFIIEYSLSRYLASLGIKADAYIGHSIGEYVAATLSGVFTLEDAIRVVISRGRLMQSMQRGSMLAVNAGEESVKEIIADHNCEIAVINSIEDIVASGSEKDIEKLREALGKREIVTVRLHTSHAYHSRLMDGALEGFKSVFKGMRLNKAGREFISNISGEIAGEEVSTSSYWCSQLRSPVQFSGGVMALSKKYNHRVTFIELGPGRGLGYFVGRHKGLEGYKKIETVQLLPSAKEAKEAGDFSIERTGNKEDIVASLWMSGLLGKPNEGVQFKDAKLLGGLPAYQFDYQKCWLERSVNQHLKKFNPINDILYERSWERIKLNSAFTDNRDIKHKNILVLINDQKIQQSGSAELLDMLDNYCTNLSYVNHKQANSIKPESQFDFSNRLHVATIFNEKSASGPVDFVIYISPGIDLSNPALDILAIRNVFDWVKNTGNKISTFISFSFDNYEVLGNEQLQEKPSIVYGVTKSIPFEYFTSGTRAFHLDLSVQDLLTKDSNYKKNLISALAQNDDKDLLIIRGKYYWFPTYQHVRLLHHQRNTKNIVEPTKVILVTGGLGAIGYSYAHHISKNNKKCTIILIGRTAESNLRDDYKSRLNTLRGTRHNIIYLAMDISNVDASAKLEKVLTSNNITTIDVVLHTAVVIAKSALYEKTHEDIEQVISPKIIGLENVIKLAGVIRVANLVNCSSLASIFPSLGNMEYTAANLYLDEISLRSHHNIDNMLAININQISDAGAAVEFIARSTTNMGRSLNSIRSHEFPGILDHLLQTKIDGVISLSRYDINAARFDHLKLLENQDGEISDIDAVKILEDCTQTEYQIAQIMGDILGVKQISIHDDFFRIGGNSILAIQVTHRMSKALRFEVRVADLFKHKTPSQLATHGLGQIQIIIPKSVARQSVLSFAQERLWFIEQYEKGTNAYHIPAIFELEKNASIPAIRYALEQVVSRHEVLRTTIEQGDNRQGIQVVHKEPLLIDEIYLTVQDDYETIIKEHINRPFDLSTSYPISVKLYRISSKKAGSESTSERRILLINTHHIASDGWSTEIFQRELVAYYAAYQNNNTGFSLPELEIQYKDYAVWQKRYLKAEILQSQLGYWKDKLSGYQNLEIPTDYARPVTRNYSGSCETFMLTKGTSERLRTLAKDYGVTLHSVLLSSVNILLGKYTGQEDIIVGNAIANRHHRQTEGVIGFFVNTQANRTRLYKSQSFVDLLQQVHQAQIAAQLHQDVPFEQLVDELKVERDTSRHPVFQVMFGMQGTGKYAKMSSDQEQYLKPLTIPGLYEVEKFDLSVFIDDSKEQLAGLMSYATGLFHKKTIVRLIGYYLHLLDQLTEQPRKAYSGLSLLDGEEYHRVIYQWNATGKEYRKDSTIYQLFEEQVERTPGNMALVYEGESLSYRELNERSNQLARYIRDQYRQRTSQELKPDTLIGLCLDRSLEMVIAILAVLKAGGAYVPIDPGYPQERIDYILADTQVELVLSQRELNEGSGVLPEDRVIYIDLAEAFYQGEDISNLPLNSSGTDLAYVIYTSGTTGRPKGVMVEHTGVINLVTDLLAKYNIECSERFVLFANYVFDASLEQLFLALLSGGSLFIIETESIADGNVFVKFIVNNKITHLHSTPSYLSAVDPSKLTTLKRIVFGAEYLSKDLFARYSKNISTVINEYGPTETTITSIVSINSHLLNNVSIQNTQIYVLDPNFNPVPVGVTGELYIGGAGLARGYLNNEALTAERFIVNPFGTESDKAKGYTRLYRTGDLVRWQPGGELEYIGRNDEQVKIRGYRVELGEVEHALSSIAGIKQSCVLAKERQTESGSSKYLAGYYVLDGGKDAPGEDIILEQLMAVLPEYMAPSVLVAMESFPLTINGKLNKNIFPDPVFNLLGEKYVAPITDMEVSVCNIWQQVLGLEIVGVTDEFFRIGGNSILAIQVSHLMSKTLACEVGVADVFKFKTIKGLLHNIEVSTLTESNILWKF